MPDPGVSAAPSSDDLMVEVAGIITDDLTADERTPDQTAQTVQNRYADALRSLAREWQAPDLMDAAAWLEGTL